MTSEPPGDLNPGQTFGFTVAVLDQYNNLIPNSGTVSVALANNPGGSALGGTTTVTVGPTGYATFTGLSLNSPGSGYTLTLSGGLSSTVTTTGIKVVTPSSAARRSSPRRLCTFKRSTRKARRSANPSSPATRSRFDSAAMNQGTLTNAGNFVMETVIPVKKTRKSPATVKLKPVRFSVTGATSNTVTLKPAGNPFAKNTGQIVVSTAVESAAGAFLTSNETLSIAKGGKRISLA